MSESAARSARGLFHARSATAHIERRQCTMRAGATPREVATARFRDLSERELFLGQELIRLGRSQLARPSPHAQEQAIRLGR